VNIKTLGIDLAKNIFQVHGVNKTGRTVLKKRLRRNKLLEYIAQLPPCLIGMEACGSANYWGRRFKELGHDVKLMSPQYVKPYIQSNKNDENDAEGICEAVTRPKMKFVPIKRVEQQDFQMLHRIRSQQVKQRTALSNQIRGLLAEYGEIIPKGISHVRKQLPEILANEKNDLTELSKNLFMDLYRRLNVIDKEIKEYDHQIIRLAQSHEECGRLLQIEGVGPLISTALISTIGEGHEFKSGRELASWLGLVPRQKSSGEKKVLLGISKRGNRYLRTLLIQGGHATIQASKRKEEKRSAWVKKKLSRSGENSTAVAIANKNARIAWALLTRGENYRQSIWSI